MSKRQRRNGDKAIRIHIDKGSPQGAKGTPPAPDGLGLNPGPGAFVVPETPMTPAMGSVPDVAMPATPAPAPEDALPRGVPDDLIDWVGDDRERLDELHALISDFGLSPMVAGDGRLLVPVSVGDWTMLIVYDARFPRPAEHGPSAAIYFVSPSAEQVALESGAPIDAFSHASPSGERYLAIDGYEEFERRYQAGHSPILAAERLLMAAKGLVAGGVAQRQGTGVIDRIRRLAWPPKYIDSRASLPGTAEHPACRRIVLSDRALVQIHRETQAHPHIETGGLLLGHYENGTWYVVEACDPGWDATFRVSYHEANEHYENHVCEVISRTYRHPLAFLGMWHRHPGSLDTFSLTDDRTNSKYIDACGNGCISLLVNYDPGFRLTGYHAERTSANGVRYHRVDLEAGDALFDNKEVLEVASLPFRTGGIARQEPEPPEGEGTEPPMPAPQPRPAQTGGDEGVPMVTVTPLEAKPLSALLQVQDRLLGLGNEYARQWGLR